MLRRHGAQTRTRLALGNVALDLTAGRLEVAGVPVLLTIRENGLLRVLLTRTPEVVSRPEMLDEVWGTHHIDQNIVDQYVRYVRRKLEAAGATAVIETVRGQGYRVVETTS